MVLDEIFTLLENKTLLNQVTYCQVVIFFLLGISTLVLTISNCSTLTLMSTDTELGHWLWLLRHTVCLLVEIKPYKSPITIEIVFFPHSTPLHSYHSIIAIPLLPVLIQCQILKRSLWQRVNRKKIIVGQIRQH